MKLHILALLLCLLPFSLTATNLSEEDRQLFIETFAGLAVDEMLAYQIPASITLAQAILESNWGRGEIAENGNNYFGIKCYNGWAGPSITAIDDEEDASCFRMYENVVQSFSDHSFFLKNGLRYQSLFANLLTDYAAWAHGLKSCGYATDSLYSTKLIGIIERYGLFVYDYAMPLEKIALIDAAPIAERHLLVNTEQTTVGGKAISPASKVLSAPVYRLEHEPGDGYYEQGNPSGANSQPISTKPAFIPLYPVFELRLE